MKRSILVVVMAPLLLASGCDKKSRTRNSSGSASLVEGDLSSAVPMYQFVTVEQTLSDARKAIAAEKWSEASAAADALLKEMPNSAEAKAIGEKARLETPNLVSYQAFTKAAGTNDAIGMAKAWRNISETSLYKERARAAFDKVKTTYVASQETDARAMVRQGRCDEARRVVRVTGDYFPDAKGRLDEIPVGCRPRDDKADKTEVAAGKAADEKVEPAGSTVAPPRASTEPTPVAAAAKPDAQKLVAAIDAPKTAVETRPAAAPAPLRASARKIPPSELEALRTGGDKTPKLPGNTKTIARRDGVKRITMAAEVCVGTDGHVSSAQLLKGSDYGEANDAVLASIRQWKFRPYEAGGGAMPVCTGVVLNYAVEGDTRCGLDVTGVGCAQ
jgi:Gram-negative bacterial TonB protein C-terminal